MKRWIIMAAASLLPFYAVVWMYSADHGDRNVNPFYVNESRRACDAEAPSYTLTGWSKSVCFEASVRDRHIVVNIPFAYAFLILPATWAPMLIWKRHRLIKTRVASLDPIQILGLLVVIGGFTL